MTKSRCLSLVWLFALWAYPCAAEETSFRVDRYEATLPRGLSISEPMDWAGGWSYEIHGSRYLGSMYVGNRAGWFLRSAQVELDEASRYGLLVFRNEENAGGERTLSCLMILDSREHGFPRFVALLLTELDPMEEQVVLQFLRSFREVQGKPTNECGCGCCPNNEPGEGGRQQKDVR